MLLVRVPPVHIRLRDSVEKSDDPHHSIRWASSPKLSVQMSICLPGEARLRLWLCLGYITQFNGDPEQGDQPRCQGNENPLADALNWGD